MSVLTEIVSKMQWMRENNKKEPVRVGIPVSVEARFYELTQDEIGSALFGRLITEGVRKTFPTVLGLTPVWDAEQFVVCSEEGK